MPGEHSHRPQPYKLGTDKLIRREPQALSHGADLELYIKIHEQYLALLNTSPNPTATLTYTLQPVEKSCVEAGRQRGGNSLGLELAPQTYLLFLELGKALTTAQGLRAWWSGRRRKTTQSRTSW